MPNGHFATRFSPSDTALKETNRNRQAGEQQVHHNTPEPRWTRQDLKPVESRAPESRSNGHEFEKKRTDLGVGCSSRGPRGACRRAGSGCRRPSPGRTAGSGSRTAPAGSGPPWLASLISSAPRRLSHLGCAVVEWEKGFNGRLKRWEINTGYLYGPGLSSVDFLTCLFCLSQLLGQNKSRPEFKRFPSDNVLHFALPDSRLLSEYQRLKCHYVARVPIINSSCITRTSMHHQ
jgi:hypothetical protein